MSKNVNAAKIARTSANKAVKAARHIARMHQQDEKVMKVERGTARADKRKQGKKVASSVAYASIAAAMEHITIAKTAYTEQGQAIAGNIMSAIKRGVGVSPIRHNINLTHSTYKKLQREGIMA